VSAQPGRYSRRQRVGEGGPSLTTVLVLGPVERFPTSKHAVSYVGLAPAIASTAGKHHLGRITKQGSPMLRHLLGQAAQSAIRRDAALKRLYLRILHRRGRARAKVAARALLVRSYIMRRDAIDYEEFPTPRRGAGGLTQFDATPRSLWLLTAG
jgi:transposase